MQRGKYLVADFQPSRLADPRQPALDDPANLAQATAVRCPWLRQMIFNPSLLESLMIAGRTIRPIAIQRLGFSSGASPATGDGRNVVHQVHRLNRIVAVGSRDPHGQRYALAINHQVPFGAFFGSIRGVFASQDPPKTARML